MTRVRFIHHIDDLADDLRTIVRRAPGEFKDVVRQAAIVGNTVARDNARASSGSHGKLYPRSFSWEMRPGFHGFGASIYSAEYGPDAAMPQGGMAPGFEHGSKNQTAPHNDLAKSADLIGGSFAKEVGDIVDRLFWPT